MPVRSLGAAGGSVPSARPPLEPGTRRQKGQPPLCPKESSRVGEMQGDQAGRHHPVLPAEIPGWFLKPRSPRGA